LGDLIFSDADSLAVGTRLLALVIHQRHIAAH
jgi:hypothetical protein